MTTQSQVFQRSPKPAQVARPAEVKAPTVLEEITTGSVAMFFTLPVPVAEKYLFDDAWDFLTKTVCLDETSHPVQKLERPTGRKAGRVPEDGIYLDPLSLYQILLKEFAQGYVRVVSLYKKGRDGQADMYELHLQFATVVPKEQRDGENTQFYRVSAHRYSISLMRHVLSLGYKVQQIYLNSHSDFQPTGTSLLIRGRAHNKGKVGQEATFADLGVSLEAVYSAPEAEAEV